MKKTFFKTIFLLLHMVGAYNANGQNMRTEKLSVAILLYRGVQIIDYTVPYEVLATAGFNVYTVAEKKDTVITAWRMNVLPTFTFENAPTADILLVPGGWADGHIDNEKFIKWIRDNSQKAKYVLTVCNGAFLLAKTGLLDGMETTTTAGLVSVFKERFPSVKMITNKRVVDNGKFISSGGLSAGIDGALYLVAKLYGEKFANTVALNLEYDWNPASKYLPATTARKYLDYPRNFLFSFRPFRNTDAFGDDNNWTEKFLVTTKLNGGELLKQIDSVIVAKTNWKRTKPAQPVSQSSFWSFASDRGKKSEASILITPVGKEELEVVYEIKGH